MYDIISSGQEEYSPFAAGADMLVGADGDFRALMAAAGADPFGDLGLGLQATAGADPMFYELMASSGADPFGAVDPYAMMAAGADPFGMADPFVSAGADMLVGRAPRPRDPRQHFALARARMLAHRNALARNAAQQRMATIGALGLKAGALVERKPTKLRKYPMGFKGDADTPAGNTVSVVRRPQVPIKLERLVVSAGVTDSFEIVDVKVGKNSQMVSSDPVPADAFGPGAFSVDLAGDTANVGHDIAITATNYSGAAKRFRGVIIGTAVE